MTVVGGSRADTECSGASELEEGGGGRRNGCFTVVFTVVERKKTRKPVENDAERCTPVNQVLTMGSHRRGEMSLAHGNATCLAFSI